MAGACRVCARMRRGACARTGVQAGPDDELAHLAGHDDSYHHNRRDARDRQGWPQPRHGRARRCPCRLVRKPAPVPGVVAPEAHCPRERRFEPDCDQPGQIYAIGYQQRHLPHRRRRSEPVHDPGEPVVGRLNGVRHRVQRPAQDIVEVAVEVATDLCPPRRVIPILAFARCHGSISTATRRAAMAPATWRFTAPWLTPMAEATCASDRLP